MKGALNPAGRLQKASRRFEGNIIKNIYIHGRTVLYCMIPYASHLNLTFMSSLRTVPPDGTVATTRTVLYSLQVSELYQSMNYTAYRTRNTGSTVSDQGVDPPDRTTVPYFVI